MPARSMNRELFHSDRLLGNAVPAVGVFVRLFGGHDSRGGRYLTVRRWLLVQRIVNRCDAAALCCPILRAEQLRSFEIRRVIALLYIVFRMCRSWLGRLLWRRRGVFDRAISGRALSLLLLILIKRGARLWSQRSVVWLRWSRGHGGRRGGSWLVVGGGGAGTTAGRLRLIVGLSRRSSRAA